MRRLPKPAVAGLIVLSDGRGVSRLVLFLLSQLLERTWGS
jgi:hypothetical protein